MTDLRKVFAEQLKEMNKAAQANVKEANNAVTGKAHGKNAGRTVC